MVNKVILIGRLTADPDVRATAAGSHVANLRLATDTVRGREEDGTWREQADFHNLVLFGRHADIAAEHLKKGRLLYAEGRRRPGMARACCVDVEVERECKNVIPRCKTRSAAGCAAGYLTAGSSDHQRWRPMTTRS